MILLIDQLLFRLFGMAVPTVFTYSSSRMLLAALTAFLLTLFLGPRVIRKLYQMKTEQSRWVEHSPLLDQLHEKKKRRRRWGEFSSCLRCSFRFCCGWI